MYLNCSSIATIFDIIERKKNLQLATLRWQVCSSMGKRAKYILQLHIRDTLNIDLICVFIYRKQGRIHITTSYQRQIKYRIPLLDYLWKQGQVHVTTAYQRHPKYRFHLCLSMGRVPLACHIDTLDIDFISLFIH